MKSKLVEIDLNSVCEGALPELFQRELTNVIRNMKDINTEEETKRKLVIEFTLEPMRDSGRSKCTIDLKVSSKLAPVKSVRSSLMLEGNKAIEQQVVASATPELSNVTPISDVHTN